MRWPQLGARDRRALGVFAVVAFTALAWMLVLGPAFRRTAELTRALDRERALLSRESGAVTASGSYAAAFRHAAPRLLRVAPRLFRGTDAMASAQFAHLMEEAARSSRVFLKQVRPIEPQQVGVGLRTIGVSVSGESDLEGLLTLLHGLESTGKLLRVEALSVHGLRAGESPAPALPEALEFEFSVTALMLTPLGSATPAADTSDRASPRAPSTAGPAGLPEAQPRTAPGAGRDVTLNVVPVSPPGTSLAGRP